MRTEGEHFAFTYRLTVLLIEWLAGNLRGGGDELVMEIHTTIKSAVVSWIIFDFSRLYKNGNSREKLRNDSEIFLSSKSDFLLISQSIDCRYTTVLA